MIDDYTGRVSADEAEHPIDDYDSDERIAERHYALRHSHRLLYYPPDAACTALCGLGDNDIGGKTSVKYTDHQCALEPQHAGACSFSSECAEMAGRRLANVQA